MVQEIRAKTSAGGAKRRINAGRVTGTVRKAEVRATCNGLQPEPSSVHAEWFTTEIR